MLCEFEFDLFVVYEDMEFIEVLFNLCSGILDLLEFDCDFLFEVVCEGLVIDVFILLNCFECWLFVVILVD